MNKYEKRFIIIDTICIGMLLGSFLMTFTILNDIIGLIFTLAIFFFYFFRLRRGVWKHLEAKEELFLITKSETR